MSEVRALALRTPVGSAPVVFIRETAPCTELNGIGTKGTFTPHQRRLEPATQCDLRRLTIAGVKKSSTVRRAKCLRLTGTILPLQ